jgi:hypothetical protein
MWIIEPKQCVILFNTGHTIRGDLTQEGYGKLWKPKTHIFVIGVLTVEEQIL